MTDSTPYQDFPTAATFYITELGFAIGTVHEGTKVPVDGHNNVTRDPELIKGTLENHPGRGLFANLVESNVIELDVDVRGDHDGHDDLRALEDRLGPLPATLTATTPSDGRKLVFRRPEGFKGRNRNLPDKDGNIEVRVNGSLTLPPTAYPGGGFYGWVEGHAPGEVEIAELPPEWIDYLQRVEKKQDGEKFQFNGQIPEGHRRRELLRYAGSLRKAGTPDDLLDAAVVLANEQKCNPSLPTSEVKQNILRSAHQWPVGDPPHVLMFDGGNGDKRNGGQKLEAVAYSEITPERVEYVLPGIPRRMGTMLAGHAGLGKSLVKAAWTARVTKPFGQRRAMNVLLLDAEDSAEAVTRPRLEAAGATLERVFLLSTREHGISLPDDISALGEIVEKHFIELLFIDPINGYLGGADYFKDPEVRRVLTPLIGRDGLADRHNIGVVLLTHLKKGHEPEALHRIGGSVAFGALVRSGFVLDRNPDDEHGEQGVERNLAHMKNNVGPKLATTLHKIEPVVIAKKIETAKITYVGESEIGANELLSRLSASNGKRRTLTEQCAQAIRNLLKDGRRDGDEIKSLLESAGHSTRTIQRAATEIVGVEYDNEDFPKRTFWKLPEKPEEPPKDDGSPVAPNPDGATEQEEVGAIGESTAQSQILPAADPVAPTDSPHAPDGATGANGTKPRRINPAYANGRNP
jgi:hypothetical protein